MESMTKGGTTCRPRNAGMRFSYLLASFCVQHVFVKGFAIIEDGSSGLLLLGLVKVVDQMLSSGQ